MAYNARFSCVNKFISCPLLSREHYEFFYLNVNLCLCNLSFESFLLFICGAIWTINSILSFSAVVVVNLKIGNNSAISLIAVYLRGSIRYLSPAGLI